MKTHILRGAATLIVAVFSVNQASAASIVLNNGNPYAEVAHANSAGSGSSLNLLTQPGGITVNLSSADTLDAGNGNGVAIVRGAGPGQGYGFSSIVVDPLTGFSVIQFKIEDLGGQQQGNDFDILVNFVGGGSQSFLNYLLPTNSKIDIFAGAGEVLDSIQLSGLVNGNGAARRFKDIKQISFNAVIPNNTVPEPATWALLIAGFGMVGSAMRRRRPVIVTA
jgi:hypothetical protein